jgi:hypothetical protein
VVSELLPQHLLGLGLVEMGWRLVDVTPLLLCARDDGVSGGQDNA